MASVFVNGREYPLTDCQADKTLLVFLRENGLTGTKLGCGEGGCGACTVMLSRKSAPDVPIQHLAVNACLCPVYAAEGCHVVTVEGIGNPRDGLHPVQEQLANAHGSQCGFCTPGFVMSMYALLRTARGRITEHDIEDALAGNLCRCTGYRPILDAFRPFTEVDTSVYTDAAIQKRVAALSEGGNAHNGSANGHKHNNGADSNGAATNGKHEDCAVHNGSSNGETNGKSANGSSNGGVKICPSTGKPCDCAGDAKVENGTNAMLKQLQSSPKCEPIFPPKLASGEHGELAFTGGAVAWHRPMTLPRLLELAKENPKCKVVGGNSEVGIEMNIQGAAYPVLVDPTLVPEMLGLEEEEAGLRVGGAASLTKLMDACKALLKRPELGAKARPMQAVVDQLQWFAGVQIRNVATLAGNIVTGSPISDLNPLWVALGATFVVQSADGGPREVAAGDFFLGYRKVDLQPGEVLVSVLVPWAREHEFVAAFKQSHRKEDDIALVNAGMRLACARKGGAWAVESAALVYGGVGPKVVVAHKAAAALTGRVLSRELLQEALDAIKGDVTVPEGAPGGMGAFRTALAASFLYKFVVSACISLADEDGSAGGGGGQFGWLNDGDRSAVATVAEGVPRGVQFHADAKPNAIVGQSERHRAAHLQVCGEAQYTGDAPLHDSLHAALVTSTQPHARLLSVDPAAALAIAGVVAFYSDKDVPGDSQCGPNFADEHVFAKDVVTCVGHPIGIVVATTHQLAMRAAAAVKVEYEPLEAVMSIDDAIAAGSFMPQFERKLHHGDVDAAFAGDDVACVIEGEARMGGQEHFYLEPQCNYVVPVEDDEFLLVASTQDVNKHHKLVARVLGVPQHKLTVKTKRLGGGFGGKETRGAFLHCATAVAAFHTRRPVRLALDRQHDMRMTGHRHAFMGAYKVAAAKDGRVLAVDLMLYNNAGNSMDLSHAVLDRAVLHSDGTYFMPNFRVHARICRTNQASNTAYRGFGGPQGMLVANMWMEHLSRELGIPFDALQARNHYKDDPTTHFVQTMEPERLWACWDGAMDAAGWADRRAAVDAFNAGSRYRKRGLAALATKFGISFTFQPMNQAGANVSVFLDGSVGLVHGGIEMGQGLHTKMCQVAAQALGVPLASVHVTETSTDKLPNASPTAASASSDLYGAAVLDACGQLNARLAPVREKLGGQATMHEIATKAWMDRVDLCAHGFYATPDVTGAHGDRPFHYFVYGAAVAEVEVDCLTGDSHTLRADVVMDVGNPINPSIDIGQVEGGFVQGMGWCSLEELKWGDKAHPWTKPGFLLTNGPGNYKIPTALNIPRDFRVRLLENMPNARCVHSSKAVGEPPFHLGSAVLFALKDAIYSARADAGITGFFPLDAPATPERVRMACVDAITGDEAASYRPLLSC